MKRKLYIFLGLAATSLWSIASASPTTYTYTLVTVRKAPRRERCRAEEAG